MWLFYWLFILGKDNPKKELHTKEWREISQFKDGRAVSIWHSGWCEQGIEQQKVGGRHKPENSDLIMTSGGEGDVMESKGHGRRRNYV